MSEFDEGVYTLVLGSFDLSGEGGGGLWRSEALADGTDLAGNPVPVEVAIQTLIQDGSVSVTEKYNNATIPIRVCIKGPDADAMDQGAAALFAELGRTNVLTYQGPLASTPIAWDVVNSHLDRNSDDLAEVRSERYYTITLSVLPWRRRTTETVTAALPASGSTTTLVDNGSSATGWTGSVSGTAVTPSSVSGAVQVTGPMGGGTQLPDLKHGADTLVLKRTGSVDTSSTKLIMVDFKVTKTVARTNLATNPSFETNATGWTGTSSSPGTPSVSRTTSLGQTGSASGQVTLASGLLFGGNSLGAYHSVTLAGGSDAGGRTFTYSAYVRAAGVARLARIGVSYYTSGAALISTVNSAASIDSTSAWTRRLLTHTAPAGAVTARVEVQWDEVNNSEAHYVDALLVEEASTVGTYFDGSFTDAAQLYYLWGGTAHASTSTETYTGPGSFSLVVSNPEVSASANGVPLDRVAQKASPTAGYTRIWFAATVNSLPDLTFTAAVVQKTGSTCTFSIDIVNRTDVVPSIGPGQQVIRSIEVGGSARTSGAVAVEHASASLGQVLAFFWKDDGSGYAPPLSPFHSAGAGITSDSARVSGGRESINASITRYDVPVSLLPRDGYQLVALLSSSVTANVTWAATTVVNGVNLGPTVTGTNALASLGGSYQIVALGSVQLPTRDIDEAGTGAVVRITVTADAAVLVDEAWALRDSGQLVQADCGTGSPSSGGPSNRLFIEPASLVRSRPVVRRGYAADRSDSFHPPGLGSWEAPEFPPPRVNMLAVTVATTGATVAFRHYERLAG